MNDEMPHDDQLRALYRKLPADEPRAQLDDAILAAARKRAREAARLRVLRRVRWTVSLAAAAGLVLTLTLNQRTSEPELKRADVSEVQLTEHAPPAGAPAAAPTPAPAPATLDALEDRDARLQDAPAAAAPARKAEPGAAYARKQEAQPLAKDIAAGRARAKADSEPPVAKPESKKPNEPAAKSAAPDGNEGSAGASTGENLSGAVRSNLQSLGSMRGSDEAAAPPPTGSGAAKRSDVVPPSAPAAPEFDIAPSKGVKGSSVEAQRPRDEAPPNAATRAAGARPRAEFADDQAADAAKGKEAAAAPPPAAESDAGDVAACEAAPEVPAAPPEPWPFGLEPGLAPEEACRRVSEAIHQECRFLAGFVDMPLTPAARIDRGRMAGRNASHLMMSLQRDKLWSVILSFRSPDGSVTQESLIAPDPIWVPVPAPTPAPAPKE